MPIAVNDAGEALYLTPEGGWEPAKIAENPQTKEKLAFDGKDWTPLKMPANPEYSAGDVGMAALRGIPIAGGVIERMSSKESQDKYKNFDAAHPWISGGAKFVGGAAALGPLGLTGTGAKLLGMTGNTLARQVGNSALSGAAIGGADAAVRGEDIGQSAEIGAGLGVAGPLVGRAIGSAIGGARNLATPVSRVPQNFETVGNVRVPLDRGQATGDVVTQRYIETARQGNFGEGAQREVNAFRDTQNQGVENARYGIRNQIGGAETTPLEAADAVQRGVQQKAAAGKAAYQQKYDQFGNMSGEVHAGAFEGVGQKIKGDLSLTHNPVIIDDVLTPAASKMIQHIETGLGRMKIQNRADPFGQPSQENIVGVSLKGVDQVRKQLVSMAGSAANATDRRAARSIMSAFDEHLEDSISRGLYSGDANALGTLKEARQLFATYSQTFKSRGSGDMAGQVVERMLGKHGQQATHNEISNWLYGASKVGGNKEAGHVAEKLRGILGDGSQEWQSVRQGLFSKLVDATEGAIQPGPQKVSQRVAEFLNGSGKQLAEQLFTTQERSLINQYGSLMRRMTPAQGAINHSGSGYQIASMMKWTLNSLATVAGLHVAGPMGALAGMAANSVGKAAMNSNHARAVARNLYNPASAPLFPNAIAPATQRAGALISRSGLGI